jgi:hypothetical protein
MVLAWLVVSLIVGTVTPDDGLFSRSALIVLALLVGSGIAAAVWVAGALILWALAERDK